MNCFNLFNSKAKTRSEQNPSPRSIHDLYKEKGHNNLRKFSFSELRNGTDNFSRLLKIGEGGFGSVYKGSIRSTSANNKDAHPHLVVAVKKLRRNGVPGHKEWLREVQFLSVVNHPKLVKLLGYCSADREHEIQRLLVYEYMPNKSLEDHLFSRAFPPIPWVTRLTILLGAAEGLAYLHKDLEIQVIFRDFKSSNVLLDESFNAKLSDFGLAREGPQGDQSHVSTTPVGTYGYAAPEYVETGHLKSNCDIWSFGVVLYEILTGRKAIERALPQPEQKLIEWVKQFPVDSTRFRMIIDPRLNNQYSLSVARSVARLADSCLRKKPEERPPISRIVDVLQRAIRESVNEECACPLPEPGHLTHRMARVG